MWLEFQYCDDFFPLSLYFFTVMVLDGRISLPLQKDGFVVLLDDSFVCRVVKCSEKTGKGLFMVEV